MNRYLIATILSMLMLIFIIPDMAYSMSSNDTNLINEIGSSSLDQAIGNWRHPIDEGVHEAKPAHVHEFIPTNDPISLSESAPQAVLSGTITIKGRGMFRNDAGVLVPMRNTKVELMDDDTGPDESVAVRYTDYNGYYTFIVNNDDGIGQGGRDPYVKIWAQNGVAYCEDGSLLDRDYVMELPKCRDNVPDGFYYDYGARFPANSEPWRAIDACLTERNWVSARTGGWQIQYKTEINWPIEEWPHVNGDEIDLPDINVKSWDRISVYHEYAHCIMYELYGDYPSGWGPEKHYPDSESSGGFAMTEGWAEFMECKVENDPFATKGWGSLETTIYADGPYGHGGAPGDFDGNIVEGAVAAILWDICDGVSTTDKDPMSVSYNTMFIIIRYDHPQNMDQFWNAWKTRYPSITSYGPLCTVYWNNRIDKDAYAPYSGSITIDQNAVYATSRYLALALNCSDWGSGVSQMRFADTRTWIGDVWVYQWSAWQTYSTSASWTLSLGDGLRNVYAQFKDNKGLLSATCSDSITLDTIKPVVTNVTISPSSFPYVRKMYPTPPLVRIVYVGNHTDINFTLSEPCYVTIKIYNNATGALAGTLLGSKTQLLPAGKSSVEWDGRYSSGLIVPIGTYRIQTYVTDRVGWNASQYPIVKYVNVLYTDTTKPLVTNLSVSPSPFPYAVKTFVTPPYQRLVFVGNHTHINFTLSEPCYVTIKIYNNATGALVKTLLGSKTQTIPAGANSVEWDARRSDGTLLPIGAYKILIYVMDQTGNGASPYPIKLYVGLLYP